MFVHKHKKLPLVQQLNIHSRCVRTPLPTKRTVIPIVKIDHDIGVRLYYFFKYRGGHTVFVAQDDVVLSTYGEFTQFSVVRKCILNTAFLKPPHNEHKTIQSEVVCGR